MHVSRPVVGLQSRSAISHSEERGSTEASITRPWLITKSAADPLGVVGSDVAEDLDLLTI